MKKVFWAGWPKQVWTAISIGVCAVLLILFAILSYSAALTKSATYDEPLHAVAGYVHRTMGDFRINPEDPALFGYWGSIPHPKGSLKINTDLKFWDAMIQDFSHNQWPFVVATLYRTEGNAGDAFIQRSRFMFTLVGIALGAVIACWSWQMGGAVAAVIATALYALDPNFTAHSSLVKNDVMLSLAMTGLAMALWHFGRRGTWLALLGIAVTCAAGVNIKFSGVLFGPIIFLILLIRALLPGQWQVVGMNLKARWQRLLVVLSVCLLVGGATYLCTWACYGFRFAPTKDPDALFNTDGLVTLWRVRHLQAEHELTNVPLTQERFDQTKPSHLLNVMVWMVDHRVLPQAWLHGFMYTYATTQIRSTFLLGQVRVTGWWYYFPCAMLFKTPTATLAAIPLVALALIVISIRPSAGEYVSEPGGFKVVSPHAADPSSTGATEASAKTSKIWRFDWWSLLCLLLPAAIYMASAMSTNLNLGLRHILPVYPFLFIGLALAFARLVRQSAQLGAVLGSVVVLGLAIESFAAYPDYIAFFNAPSGGSRGGIELLGDSNLDWGQDLKLLANWQKQHTDKPLYLSYFGVAEPKFYHVDATHLPIDWGGWVFTAFFGQTPAIPQGPCYFAVSATNLQGIYVTNSDAKAFYVELRKRQPLAILGGSIYIYEFPLPPA